MMTISCIFIHIYESGNQYIRTYGTASRTSWHGPGIAFEDNRFLLGEPLT